MPSWHRRGGFSPFHFSISSFSSRCFSPRPAWAGEQHDRERDGRGRPPSDRRAAPQAACSLDCHRRGSRRTRRPVLRADPGQARAGPVDAAAEMTTTGKDKRLSRRIGMTAAVCTVFVAAMVGMAFASVPLYRIFCSLTGYGGTTQRANVAPKDTLARTVTVRFDANVANGLGWSFRPETRSGTVKVGAPAEGAFLPQNPTRAEKP